MIKTIIVTILIINICACEPIQAVSKPGERQKPANFTCLTSQSQCEINSILGRFTVQLSGALSQGKIKTDQPFHIQLQFNAANDAYHLKNISSYLEGKTMFMGKIPVFFERDKSSDNSRIAESLLVSCSEEIMTWRLWFHLEITGNEGIEQQDFFIDFDSQR